MSNPLHIFFFTLIVLFWGGSFLAIGVAVQHLPPFYSAFLRILICLVSMTVYLLFKEKRIERPKVWLQSMGSGLFLMGFPWLFLFWGEKFVAPALAAIINGTVPIFTTLLMPLITPSDKWTWKKWIGILSGFGGILWIFTPEISGTFTPQLQGLLAIVMMAICYAIGVLWTRRIANRVRNSVNLFYQSLGGLLPTLAATLLFEIPHHPLIWNPHAYLAILYLGLFSTTIAWLFFFQLIKEVGSLQASATTYCIPLVAILLDIIYFGKWIEWNQGLGVVIILIGVFLIHRPLHQRKPAI